MRTRILLLLCAALAAFSSVTPASGQLLITEFMAANGSGLKDEDGAYSDWIEIYNSASTNVNAGGWYLTDNNLQLTKWQFPSTNIAPNSFIIVFASSKNRRVTGQPLHANFSLAAGGEYLALVRPDGVTKASEFPSEQQYQDLSYGYIMTGVPTTLLPAGSSARALVPGGDIGTSWRNIGFNDASWQSGTIGVGYDQGTNYLPAIGLNVGATMSNVNASAYVRVPFSVTDPATYKSLQLRMRYDDGFVAYLNGTEVLRRNAPTTPQWNSSATASHGPPAAGQLVQNFDGQPVNYVLQQNNAAPPPSVQPAAAGTTGNFLRLVSDPVNNQFNSLTFAQTAPGAFEKITADFDFRITDAAANPADGFALMFIPTATYGTNGNGITVQPSFGIEEPNYPGVFAIGFDVYPHATANDVSVHWNGSERLNVSMPRATLEMVAAQFHRVQITLLHVTGGARVTVTFTANINGAPAAPYTPITNFFVPDLNAYDCRVQFAARTGGADMHVDLDNINVQFTPPPALVAFEDFDITPFRNLLVAGPNVLAVHGLNLSAANEDFLIEPQLIGADFVLGTQVDYLTPATPGSWNNVSAAGRLSPVTFFPPPGAYTSNSLEVTLSSASSSSVIRFTLDGSTPTENSFQYIAPLNIGANTVLRARTFQAGSIESEVTAANYVLIGDSLTNFASNLPVFVIDTSGGNIVADSRIPAYAVMLETNGPGNRTTFNAEPDWQGRIYVELKGQSSLGFPKNSMNVELNSEDNRDKRDSLLGMPAGSDWVLYAPYTDKTLMNDYLTFELHEAMGHYAVRRRFVEVFVRTTALKLTTNEYRGIFVLLEKIRIDNDRVDINEPQSGQPGDPITGGYIFKRDKGSPGDIEFTTLYQTVTIAANGVAMQYHDPDGTDLTPLQRSWLTNHLNEFESVLYSPNWRDPLYGYRKYIDVDSFVDQHWIVDFPKNIDGYRLSNYMQKDRGEKIRMEPIWDWNLSWGNANYLEGGYTNNWYHPLLGGQDDIWLSRLRTDPDFYQKIIDRWGQLRTNVFALSNLLARVTTITNQLNEAQVREFQRWPRLSTYVWPNPDGANTTTADNLAVNFDVNYATPGSYPAMIGEMKKWITGRHAWVESRFLRAPTISRAGGPITNNTPLSITAPLGAIYYTLDGTDPRASGGAISSAALLYSGTINLTNNAGVFARAFLTNGWSPPAREVFVITPPTLAISEIMYHPEDPAPGSLWTADDFEYLEIKNTGANAINLQGAYIGGGIDFAFRPNVLVPLASPTSNSFGGGGTTYTPATLNNGGSPDSMSGFMRLIHGGNTNLARNRIAFNQTAAGTYGRVTADFDFRATTVPPNFVPGVPTLQNFDVAGAPYTLGGPAVVTAADAGSQGSFLRLVPAVNSQVGTVGFDRSTPGAWNTMIATFDFRITPGVGQADGMAFVLLNTANFGTNGAPPAISEEANVINSLGVGIDVYNNAEINNNHISLHWNNAIVGAPSTPPFDLSNGQFHRMQIITRMSGGRALVTVRITPNINGTPGSPATLFQDQVINGVNPYEMRAAFGARTGGENAAHDVDNLSLQFANEGGTSGGLSMLLLPKTPFGVSGAGSTLANYTDAPVFSNTLALDLTFHPSNYVNDAALYWNGANIGSVGLSPATLNLDNGLFHRAHVELTSYVGGSYATVVLTPDVFGTPGTPIIIMSNQFITGLLPGDMRLEFAGRNGMIDTTLDVDNVLVKYEAFDSLMLGPGESILVVNNLAAFESRYGTGFRIAGEYDGNLNNAGDRIILYGPVGEVLLDFSYSDDWYKISDGLGFSLVNRNPGAPGDFNTPDPWRNSTYQGGSPGVADPVLPIAPVVVNEVLANSVLPDVDLIELHNPTLNTVNIGGWFLTDDLFTPKKFRIPDGTTLLSGGFIVFNESDFNPVPGSPTSFLLGSDGDEIWLFSGDANTNLTGYVHGFDFGPSEEGVSFGRYVDGGGDDHFVAQIANTFNATNAGPRVGPVVISEIMYRPPDVGYADNDLDEYIELHNTGVTPVDLFSSALPTDTWQFTEGVTFTFPLNVTLAAGERALVVSFDPANASLLSAFRNKFSVNPAVQIFGPWSGKLDNSTDDVELRRPLPPGTNGTTYTLVDKVDYRDSEPWSPVADGYGASLHRLNSSAYGNDSANWTAATPTAGAAFGGGSAPSITAQPTDASVLAGSSTNFSVSVLTPEPTTLYRWRAFGTNINGGTNANLALSNIQLSDAGDYVVAIYNFGGGVLSTPAHLSVLSPVTFTLQPLNQDVVPGTNNVTLTSLAVGTGPVRYQWRFNGVNIPNATNATYVFHNANLNDHHGDFSVVASDDVSSTVSSNAFIYVLVRPGIVQHLFSQGVLQGSTVTLSLVATGAPPLWYRWIRGGSGFATTSVPALVITNFQATTTFRVGVTNKAVPAGVFSPTSGSITLTLIPDADKDGLGDAWEIAYFGSTNANNAALDTDGDGMTDGDEFRSGTNPTNALSVLKVIFTETNANVLSFVAQTNLSYSVQWRSNLSEALWANLTNLFPSNQVRTITVDSGSAPPGTERYFRVVTPLAP